MGNETNRSFNRPTGCRWAGVPAALALAALGAGCGEPVVPIAVGGATLATAALGMTPGPELKQVFYVGSLDPQGQLPPEVYRITVRGQASVISRTRFASGWVPAGLADTLTSNVSLDSSNGTVTTTGDERPVGSLANGRRLVLFGPDGFRDAPRDHRLVLTMGADADAYFDAINSVLGDVAAHRAANSNAAIGLEVIRRERIIDAERDLLAELQAMLQRDANDDLRAKLAAKSQALAEPEAVEGGGDADVAGRADERDDFDQHGITPSSVEVERLEFRPLITALPGIGQDTQAAAQGLSHAQPPNAGGAS